MSSPLTGPAADRPPLTPPSGPASSKASEVAHSHARGAEASARRAQNAQIMQASLQVSLKSGNDAQALLFRSAIDAINEHLAPVMGNNAIQNAAASQDNSAEATAGRILDFATGFFDAYAAQRPNDDPEQVARDFVDLIRGGFEKGFGEARDILSGLGVFAGDVESGVMKTHELVHKGLDDFLASKLPPAPETAATVVE
ncbi:MAG: DUF5610 domain-containing protein [Rhodocyclaceae bacterium]